MATWGELKEKYTWGQLKQFKYEDLLNSSIDDLKKMEAGRISKELDKELQRLEELGQSYVGQYNLTIEDTAPSKPKTDWDSILQRAANISTIAQLIPAVMNSDFVKKVCEFIIKLINENS